MSRKMIAEWERQSAVLLALPRKNGDWSPYIDEILEFYDSLIAAIKRFERVVLICEDDEAIKRFEGDRVVCAKLRTNDTWARDFGAIAIEDEGKTAFLDFEFNGWGLKFAANYDNQINAGLNALGFFGGAKLIKTGWILEGGSVESDGAGTIMTTENCLFAPNRNANWTKADFEERFRRDLGAKRVLWLKNGRLENDDTDAHIDTLARFCDPNTIAFVGCDDDKDSHYKTLKAMKDEILAFKKTDGTPYRFIELPMCDPIYYEGERLPATYANFLIINDAVIAPIYGVKSDEKALLALKTAFANREIIALNASVAARQHGSIHCLSMQLPASIDS
ncbi:MAG: agmatine deiminase family protein [Helicobacteraceae bacterium]|jgi:agmatine/peptidylarginine deiminase|nr:agmatine deiminase family protein [Helicobacteraceae bacterium]